ncbi:hypothetical protein Cgig2_031228 [Carnegiea gigantea]|uniref:Uncharacterized protein n=1 Tax=Carnegiea gigantea TaxID=171969 RepID=A0A9Q1KKR8_9CARY|nr:hypothetical protein Cgig2_031228 [Carnegiea gigantea]
MKTASTRTSMVEEVMEDVEMGEGELTSPHVPDSMQDRRAEQTENRTISYRDTLQRNNPNLTFKTRENPIWDDNGDGDVLEDDEPLEDDDPTYPTILLTAAEKRMLREPWRNALIEADTSHPPPPEEESIYSSWMIVRKPTRKKTTRQQPQPGGRSEDEVGLNRQANP